jgi:hypothetical protein
MALNLRLPPDLDRRARVESDRLHVSLNSLICVALDRYLASPEVAPLPWGFRPYEKSSAPSVVLQPGKLFSEAEALVISKSASKGVLDPLARPSKAQRRLITAQARLARKVGDHG